jgi:uncharacterized protein YciI
MALFVLICHDRPGHLALRMATREAHLAYVRNQPLPLKVAGPIFNDAGEMAGSLLVFETDDRAAIEAFAANDPYGLAGLFERHEILTWKASIGNIG